MVDRSARMRALNADPIVRAKREAAWKKPKFLEDRRKRMIVKNADPAFIAKRDEALKKRHDDPEFAPRQGQLLAKLNTTIAFNRARHAGILRYHCGVSKDIKCPRWIPKDLMRDFFDMTKLYGEEAAASIVRRMKVK